jgi:hypothetical protein
MVLFEIKVQLENRGRTKQTHFTSVEVTKKKNSFEKVKYLLQKNLKFQNFKIEDTSLKKA